MLHSILRATTTLTFPRSVRCISTSVIHRRNIRNIEWDDYGNSRFKEMRKKSKDPMLAYQDYGYRKPGIEKDDGTFEVIPEMIPDIIVPDLTGFKLKPYVSYRAPDVTREELTAQKLFNAVYKKKIIEDFKNNELLEDGKPKNPSPEEDLKTEDALLWAKRTGSDIFSEDPADPDPIEIKYYR